MIRSLLGAAMLAAASPASAAEIDVFLDFESFEFRSTQSIPDLNAGLPSSGLYLLRSIRGTGSGSTPPGEFFMATGLFLGSDIALCPRLDGAFDPTAPNCIGTAEFLFGGFRARDFSFRLSSDDDEDQRILINYVDPDTGLIRSARADYRTDGNPFTADDVELAELNFTDGVSGSVDITPFTLLTLVALESEADTFGLLYDDFRFTLVSDNPIPLPPAAALFAPAIPLLLRLRGRLRRRVATPDA